MMLSISGTAVGCLDRFTLIVVFSFDALFPTSPENEGIVLDFFEGSGEGGQLRDDEHDEFLTTSYFTSCCCSSTSFS